MSRLEVALQSLRKMEQTIAPFIKPRRLVRAVCSGEWQPPMHPVPEQVGEGPALRDESEGK